MGISGFGAAMPDAARRFWRSAPSPSGICESPRKRPSWRFGCSRRAAPSERLNGSEFHRDTVCNLLVTVGRNVGRYMDQRIMNVPAEDVQADELWSYVRMKQRAKRRLNIEDPWIGDQYCFVGIERNSKPILAWHLGQRTREHAVQFHDELAWVTGNRFQLSTDAWAGYKDSVQYCLGGKVDFATVEKHYAQPPTDSGRYSPPVVTAVKKQVRLGKPDPARICTSHIERQDLTIRTQVKRIARLTLSFSKKWENLKAALAWHFAFYNFVRVNGSLRVTAAMEAGLTDHVWTVGELLETAATH